MLQCKTKHKRSIFVNEAGVSAEKPDQTSFATHMHFIVQIKTMSISKEIQEKGHGECKYLSYNPQ
jgi:hypothetical protein